MTRSSQDDELLSALPESPIVPSGMDRRAFLMRTRRHRRGGRDDRNHLDARSPRAAGRDGGGRTAGQEGSREDAMPASR